MSNNWKDDFEAQLIKDGAIEKLAAFRDTLEKLKGDEIAQAMFVLDAYAVYRNIPNRSEPERWSKYVETGEWEGWVRIPPTPPRHKISFYNGIPTF